MSDDTKELELDIPVFLDEPANDDSWGDFGAVLSQIEHQESAANDDTGPEESEPKQPQGVDTEHAVGGLLEAMFTLSEKAISRVNNIEFSFDEDGKAEVIDAAVPVLNKYGGDWIAEFEYVEEVMLVVAVFMLWLNTKDTIALAKTEQRKLEQAKQEQSNGEQEAA